MSAYQLLQHISPHLRNVVTHPRGIDRVCSHAAILDALLGVEIGEMSDDGAERRLRSLP